MKPLSQDKDEVVIQVAWICYGVRIIIPAFTDLPDLLFEFAPLFWDKVLW